MQYAAFMLILFIANTVQTITGFAGNLLAMPPSIRLLGAQSASAVINIFTVVACLIITLQNRRFIRWNILAKMIGFMLAGMVIGTFLLKAVAFDVLLKAYGCLILFIALNRLFFHIRMQLPSWGMYGVLILAGVIHGMFLSGGAMLVVYAVTVLTDKDEFRATVAPVWVVLGTALVFTHFTGGYYTPANLWLILASLVPLGLSVFVGGKLYGKLDQAAFLKLTYLLLIVSGVVAIV